MSTPPATDGVPETTSEPATERDALDRDLHTILGRRAPGGVALALLGWCQRAAVHLLDPGSVERRLLSEWGATALRLILARLLESGETIPPALQDWLRESVLPGLLAAGGGGGEAVVTDQCPDVTLLLLQCMFHTASVLHTTSNSRGAAGTVDESRRKRRDTRR